MRISATIAARYSGAACSLLGRLLMQAQEAVWQRDRLVKRTTSFPRQQVLARRQEWHIGPALVELEPALLGSALDAGAELCPARLKRVEEWVVDLLDMDSAVLYRLDGRSQLNELVGGDFRIGKRAFGDVLHRWNQNLKPMLGRTCPRLCTDPAAPHAEQTRRKPTHDRG
ncbi:hypothetical protein [Bradyrhizobium sp. WSM471]|uniref:hypothetical protein n=1 Tax=Bradyrhizobium sp. WSM471 TaxID=319017 RepID=UPI000567C70D|nr:MULTISPECIES: hypothetical protein [Bradyrhizobium]UFW43426.1 hypothetical protein BcanWSM471_10225 [Bradyrhizobium canariense]